MPGHVHAIVNELFRNSCELPAELLPPAVVAKLHGLVAESAPAEVAQIKPAEHRADAVTLYRDAARRVRFAVIVEVQQTANAKKRWTWPHYIAGVRVRYRCPTYLLVVTLDAPVARWARHVIELGHPGFELRPLVISPHEIPIVESAATVERIPELAVLSALAHRSVPVAAAALAGIEKLTGEQAVAYIDAILGAVPQLAQLNEEGAMLKGYKFQSEYFRKLIAMHKREGRRDGLEQGRRKAQQRMVLEVARAKAGPISAETERALRGLADEAVLSELLIELAQARDAAQVRAVLARRVAAKLPARPRRPPTVARPARRAA